MVEFDYEEERSQTCFFRTKEEMENTVEYSSKIEKYILILRKRNYIHLKSNYPTPIQAQVVVT